MIRYTLLAIAMAGLAAPCLSAEGADLMTVYRDALANDATYTSARAALVAGEEKGPQGRSLLLPQINATASDNRNAVTVVEPPYPTYAASYTGRGFGLTLTQPVFRWSNFQQYQQGKLSVAFAEAQFLQAQQDLILRVAQAYFDVLSAQDSITFLSAQKTAISEQLASAKRNFEVGTATITDTNEAQARFDLASAQEIAASSDLEVKLGTLGEIIGRQPATLAPLRPGVRLMTPTPGSLNPWVDQAQQQSPSVIEGQAQFEIARRQIQVEEAGRYPTLDVVASRNFSRSPSSFIPPTVGSTAQNSVGIQLSVPLFTGGYVSSKVRESIALRDKAQSDLEAARRNAAQAARTAYVGVTSGLAQVQALEAAERSSQSALESNKVGYQVGIRINIDVLNAQQQLYSTERDLSKARYDTLLNGLKLKAAAGALREDDLQAVNALLAH